MALQTKLFLANMKQGREECWSNSSSSEIISTGLILSHIYVMALGEEKKKDQHVFNHIILKKMYLISYTLVSRENITNIDKDPLLHIKKKKNQIDIYWKNTMYTKQWYDGRDK